jgi:hypothetical protein
MTYSRVYDILHHRIDAADKFLKFLKLALVSLPSHLKRITLRALPGDVTSLGERHLYNCCAKSKSFGIVSLAS